MKTTQRIAKTFLAAVMALSLSPFASLPAYAVDGVDGNATNADTVANASDVEDSVLDAIADSAQNAMISMASATPRGIYSAANVDVGSDSDDEGAAVRWLPSFSLTASADGDGTRGEGDEAASGTLSNDWVWQLVEGSSEGTYTLEFKYMGEADPAPALAIPASFVANNIAAYADKVTALDLPERVTQIGNNAFQNLTALESVKFPSTVTSIGDNAFNGCSALVSADFSAIDGLEVTYPANGNPSPALSIGASAFAGSGLTAVSLPDNLNSIGNNAFQNCKSLASVDLPALSYVRGTLGTAIFSGDSALEYLTFRAVEGRLHYNSARGGYLPDNTLNGCTALKKLDFSGYKDFSTSYTFSMNADQKQLFPNNEIPNLEQVILPERPSQLYGGSSTANAGAFANKSNFTDIDVIKNPEYITSVGAYSFYGTGLTDADLSDWTALTAIQRAAFASNPSLEHVVIPENVTIINNQAFFNDPSLESFELRAKNLTTVGANDIFKGDDNLKTVTIGSEVDSLTGNFLVAVPAEADVVFEGDNLFSVTKATFPDGEKPLNSFSGNYFASSNGVVYKLDDDGTASVAYINPDVTSATIPATITTPDGQTYTVDKVDPYAANKAKSLNALTFANPSQVSLSPHAFTGWTTSASSGGKTINGQTATDPSNWAFASTLCDFPLTENTSELVPSITDIIKDSDNKEVVKTVIAVNGKNPSEDDTYDYKTGQKATYTIAISNEDNMIMDKVVRVYFAYDGQDYQMGSFPVGDYYLDDQGEKYPMTVVETETPGIYYYDITGVKPGRTLAFQNDVFFPSPNSAGGSLLIWTHTMSEEQAEELYGKVMNPKDYMELDWDTTPVQRNLRKAGATAYDSATSSYISAVLRGTDAGDVYVRNLAFTLTESNNGSGSYSEGQDFIRWVQYEDVITLPEELYWREGAIEAIENGKWTVSNSSISTAYSSSNTARTISVNINGTNYNLLSVYSDTLRSDVTNDTYGICGLTPTVITEDGVKKIKISWYVNNRYLNATTGKATSEHTVHTFYVRAGDTIVLADMDKVDELVAQVDESGNKLMPVIQNHAEETRHYTYSDDQTAEANANQKVNVGAGLAAGKSFVNGGSKNGGQEVFMQVRFVNTGVITIDQWGAPVYEEDGTIKKDENGREVWNGNIYTDTLNYYFYITPQNIERMLLNNKITLGGKTVDLGAGVIIDVTKGTLCTPGQYQPTEGTDQTNKYSTGTNISASADNGARVFEGATLKFTRTEDGLIAMKLSGDTIADNNRTYTIGAGGDYASVKAAFDALGYFPTHNTIYKVTYHSDDFALRAGQTAVLPLYTSYKPTPMMLEVDQESLYRSSSIYTYNTAYYGAKVGDSNRINQGLSLPSYGYWNYDLTFYKYGYIQGSSTYITDSSVILHDGTVVDYRLDGTNRSGIAYETMSMNDQQVGAQVVLVPKAQNPDLTAPGGGALHTYTASGVDYWVLNVPGTYENVVIGALGSRTGTQNQVADITVSETVSGGKRTSLNTTINWEPWSNWGGTNTTTSLWYKTLVSGYESGLVKEGEADEGATYRIDNKAWLGDHQGHRLYDTVGKYYQVFDFDKKIVDNETSQLVDYSRVRHGDTVTYEIDIACRTNTPAALSGNRISDRLPDTKGVFAWTRGGDGVEANVTNLRYVGSEGVKITVGTGDSAVELNTDGSPNTGHDDYWTIAPTSTTGLYEIRWPSDFKVAFPDHGTLKILVDVTFPERSDEGASKWDQYLAKVKGAYVYNYFYLDGRSDYAYHSLEAEGKAVLYKGVYDTGITTHRSGSYSYYGQYATNKSRLMYSNGSVPSSYTDTNLRASTVTYYTVLYNGSYDRLYLSDIQDQLPRGFTFNSMTNRITTVSDLSYGSSYYQYGTVGYTGSSNKDRTTTEYSSSNQLVSIDNSADTVDENTVTYANATVQAYTSNGSDGRQHISFRVTGGANYDSTVGKYYLAPGQALRFGYNVVVDEYAKTDDVATNTVAMPYYDYYGTGFVLDTPENEEGTGGAIQKARAATGVTPNDGGCQQMTADEVASKYGMSTAGYQAEEYISVEGGNWLVSDVSLQRGPIVPGINKAVGGSTVRNNNPSATTIQGSTSGYGTAYSGGLKTSDVVNWRVRVYNEAGAGNEEVTNSMQNYTVTDKVVAPYAFTGTLFYNMYRATGGSGTIANQSPISLFTIGSRMVGSAEARKAETSVRFAPGGSLSNSGYRNVAIGSAEDDSDDDWFIFGTGTKEGRVKLERNADGEEVLTIQFIGRDYSIPGGMWYDFCLHTMYVDDGVVISEAKYNEAIVRPIQDYDAEKVAQGRARTIQEYDESGSLVTKNDGVQSGASVMLTQGFTTQSWKKVTENGNPANTASSDEADTQITVSEKCETFKYDLYIVGPDIMMTRIVLIDDLPHEGDHSAFVEADKRFSDFKVGFLAENPDFKVTIAPAKGGAEVTLDPSQYTLSVATKTEFNGDDWDGAGTGWTEITSDMSADEVKAILEDAMSVRVMIKDPNAWIQEKDLPSGAKYLMSKKCQIHLSFNAKVDDGGAYPGKSAWNSFGYRYQVPLVQGGTEESSTPLALEAQPLSVGVRYPASPSIEKKLIEEETVMEPVTEEVEVPVMVPVYQTDEEGNVITDPGTGDPVPVVDEEGNPVMTEKTEPVYQTDEEGNVITDPETGEPVPAVDEDGNPITRVVTKTETRTVTEIVEVPVIDSETGKQKIDEDGNPVTEQVEQPVMQPKMQQALDEEGNPAFDENGNPIMEPVTETVSHAAIEDMDFEFIVYEGEAISALDDALNMTRADIAKILADEGRLYVYSQLTIKAGESSSLEGLWNRDNASCYDPEADEFIVLDPDTPWHWRGGQRYTLLELPFGTYDYAHRSTTVGNVQTETNNVAFDNSNASILRLVATNEWMPEYVDVSVAKAWDDADDRDGLRPESITIHLLADGEEVDKAVVTADDDWAWTFEHHLKRTETGKHITYTVTEDSVEKYTTVIEADANDEYSISVTNTHEPETTSVPVSKIWDDANNRDGLRPASIVVHLFADGKDTEQALTLTESDDWKGEFKDLPKYRDQGIEIAYTVTEDRVDNYTMAELSGDATTGYVLTNVHNPEKLSINGSKTWVDNDNKDGTRPESITVNLLANGKIVDSRTVTAEDDWAWSFEDLPKYRAGVEIQYAITEDAVENYTTTIDGFDVTNTYTAGETSLLVVKFWDDANNKDGNRTDSVEVKLLADGAETGQTLKLTEDMNWTGSFTELPKYRSDGTEIEYSVTEDQVPGYGAPEITGSVKHGFVVRNPRKPMTVTGDALPIAALVTVALAAAALAFIASRRRRHEG